MAFWAHNGHISAGQLSRGVSAAGAYLRSELGAAYYPLALTFHHGTFQALRLTFRGLRGPAELSVPPPSKRSVEHTLGQLAAGSFVLDLRDTSNDPVVHSWAVTKQAMRAYGSVAFLASLVRNQTAPILPDRDFDGIAFVRNTTRTRPLGPQP